MNLTVIGGGSSQWMTGLMRDVYLMDVPGGEIRLIDPIADRVEPVADMLRTFNRLRDKAYEIAVVPTADRSARRDALKNSDFVMTTFSPGSMDAFFNDLEIPIKYGIRQPVSMTVGPCGISAAIRTVPVAHEIVEDMEAVCPQAVLLNVTNPMSTVTRAMNMAAETVPIISMCHEFNCAQIFFHNVLGLPQPDNMALSDYFYTWLPDQGFDYVVAGLNHFIWLIKATLKGEDVLPKFRAFARERCLAYEEGQMKHDFTCTRGAKAALCDTFGFLPLAGDRHLVEFWPSLCNPRNGFGMCYSLRKTTVAERRNGMRDALDKIQRIIRGEEPLDWHRGNEEMTNIMDAIMAPRAITTILNTPNTGQITNMPRDVVVETFATVSPQGIQPTPSGDLPGPIGSLCRLHADVHELTVRAGLTGSRDLLVQALALDPLSGGGDFSEMGKMADELLAANKEWLPRFHT